nr:HEAT repeat-containing protein 5B [Tanacetum cinerariifolium]
MLFMQPVSQMYMWDLLYGLKAILTLRSQLLEMEILNAVQGIFQSILAEGGISKSRRRASSDGLGLLARLGNDMFTVRLASMLLYFSFILFNSEKEQAINQEDGLRENGFHDKEEGEIPNSNVNEMGDFVKNNQWSEEDDVDRSCLDVSATAYRKLRACKFRANDLAKWEFEDSTNSLKDETNPKPWDNQRTNGL